MTEQKIRYTNMAFKADAAMHEKIQRAAKRQGRSLNNLLTILIKEQVDYYEKVGWEKLDPIEPEK